MSKGIFIIDANSQVTWTNWPEAAGPDAGVKVVRGRIITVTAKDQKTLDAALKTALTAADGVPQPLTVIIKGADGSQRHIIHVVPMHRPQANARSASQAAPETKSAAPPEGAMVFVVDPAKGIAVAPEMLQTQLGLSPSESRVASLVAAGERPRDIAVTLGLTEDSARVILKRVFAKANVSRQSELVALISGLTSMPMR